MILADENIHGFIIKTLRTAGFEVASVREHASGIRDEKVIELAIENNYLLLTEDKDFGEWVFAHHTIHKA
jgi:predicted nuclease of predicted toxin-antitoxin system